ncbi:Cyclopentanol dehydrogenase [Balamuthia mandrillaris]
MERLAGKVAMITGAVGAIGGATAQLFAKEGAKVFLVDVPESPLPELAGALGQETAAYHTADVCDESQVKAAVEACVHRFGGLDILVTAAGITGSYSPEFQQSGEEFQSVMRTNLLGLFHCIKHAAVAMSQTRCGGNIVAMSALTGYVGLPGFAAYAASMHGVLGLVRGAANELASKNIRVNAVAPGPIDNQMTEYMEEQMMKGVEEHLKESMKIENKLTMKRKGKNEEVARVVLFLASEDSSFCTGTSYVLDGGYLSK